MASGRKEFDLQRALSVGVVDVRRLRNAAPVHRPFGIKLAWRLVPPDRASFPLFLLQIGLFFHQLTHEYGVLGFVEAAGQHHGVGLA